MLPDDDIVTEDFLTSIPEPSPPQLPTRQRAVAQVRPISMIQVVRDIAGRDPLQAVRDFDMSCMAAPEVQPTRFPAWCQHVQTAGLKRKAAELSRSECEVFAFLTKNTTSLEQAKQLLDIITNVCIFSP